MLRRNVLIFQTGALGDFILTWPLAIALGRIYPQSRIFYVTHQQKGELVRRVLRLEATDMEMGWHALFAEGGALPQAAHKLLQSAHAIYTFLPTSPTWMQNVQRVSPGIKCVELPAKLPPDSQQHLTDFMVESLPSPEKSALAQMLRSIEHRGVGFKPAGGNDILLHPGSGSPAKRWGVENFLALGQMLKSAGRSIRFVIGEVEVEQFTASDRSRLAAIAPIKVCDTCLALLSEISTAAVFVGNDSGPAHLAGIIGIPTVALFGPTHPANWKPLGPTVRVIQNDPLAHLPIETTFNQIEQLLSLPKSREAKNEVAADD